MLMLLSSPSLLAIHLFLDVFATFVEGAWKLPAGPWGSATGQCQNARLTHCKVSRSHGAPIYDAPSCSSYAKSRNAGASMYLHLWGNHYCVMLYPKGVQCNTAETGSLRGFYQSWYGQGDSLPIPGGDGNGADRRNCHYWAGVFPTIWDVRPNNKAHRYPNGLSFLGWSVLFHQPVMLHASCSAIASHALVSNFLVHLLSISSGLRCSRFPP